ncbi:MAG: dicarboxylate/amino acid:cation symporter, partial [Candidatus Omnitrophica bacterium]|nr:dicarboxylate/amino acid:cation symporter [Candidatus Omnitrophota bacterium]
MSSDKSANLLLIGIVFGLILGCLFGIGWIGQKAETIRGEVVSSSPELSPHEVEEQIVEKIEERHDYRVVELLGHLFINALRMLVVPLIVFSMITGIANLGDIRHVGKTGRLAIVYFLITTALSVGIGILLVNVIQPGVGSELVENKEMGEYAQSKEFSFYEVIEGFVSPNIVEAMAKMDILPILIFSLVFGAILTTLGEKGKQPLGFFDACNEAILTFVQMVIWFAPVGVFGLVGSKIGIEVAKGNLGAEMSRLAWYVFTVLTGLGIHGLVTLTVILFVFGKKNPFTYLKALSQALLTAFSTSSSSATLPVTMKCVEERGGVSSKYASFVCPLGATINMDGTALYESVAVIFVAQALGYPLDAS